MKIDQMEPCNFSVAMMPIVKTLALLGERHWWLSLLLWITLVGPAQAAVELRVAIKKNVQQLQLGTSTSALVKDAAGRKLGEITAMNSFAAQATKQGVSLGQWQSDQLIVEPKQNGYIWIGDRWYRGSTRILRGTQGITAINLVDLEEYLYSVVGSEVYPTWPLEALKAQAVAARSYALYQRFNSKNRLYDLETTTNTQVYKGLESEFVSTHQAVNTTAGQIMTYNGQVILAVFHSSSGGHTENVEDIWTSPLPYLRGVADFDHSAPVFEWTKSFSGKELSNRIGGIGNIKAMIPERVTPQGRVVVMKVVGDRAMKKLSGAELRKALDLRSTLFRVAENNGRFQIQGRGFGHGLGLSQWGAYFLAQQGINYQQILHHYYPSAKLSAYSR
jgi:stage II sporulation protein D